jgi:hypothetical protein
MANGKLTKAEKRRRAQQSNRDRSSRGTQNNNQGAPLASTQTHTIMTMSSVTPQTSSATAPVWVWNVGPGNIPALRTALSGCVSWRIKSCQAYIIPTLPATTPAVIGLLVTPEEWGARSLSELQSCGATISKSTVAKVSSNTIGAETAWRLRDQESQYRVYFATNIAPATALDLGIMEYRIVVETRGIAPPPPPAN